jgi:hypothetical protein
MNHNTSNVLIVIGLAAVMVAGTIAVGSGNMAFAFKGNNGISVPTDTQQKQECQTAGGTSLITGSCTALSTNVITQTGGILGELKTGSEGKIPFGDNGKGNGNGHGNDGISVPTDTNQKQECQTAGGVSPITASCTALSTNINSQLGGLMSEVKVR